MSQVFSNLWFSDRGEVFRGSEDYYFDKSLFPWIGRIEAQWTTIRDELLDLAAQTTASMVPYPNHSFVSKPNQWKTFGLMFWTVRSKTNCAKAPKTWEILRTIPDITAASFNLLEAGATIKEHYGNTNAIARCHLGLVVPAPAPQCAFRVGKEVRSWREGEFLVFCDAHNHTAWNNTDRKRYILIVDVMRPQFAAQKNAIASRVLAEINLDVACQRYPWLSRLVRGAPCKSALLNAFRAFYWCVIRLRVSL